MTFALARADTGLLDTLRRYGLLERVAEEHLFGNLVDAVDAFLAQRRSQGGGAGPAPGAGRRAAAERGPAGQIFGSFGRLGMSAVHNSAEMSENGNSPRSVLPLCPPSEQVGTRRP